MPSFRFVTLRNAYSMGKNGLNVAHTTDVTRQMAFLIAAVFLGVASVGYAAAVWLTNDLRAWGLGVVPAAMLAAALVGYFEWRSELRDRILIPSSRSSPAPGDVLVSEPTARADVYAISIVPGPAQMVAERYPDAIETVRDLARERRVDGWYTGDHTHYAQVARYRTKSNGRR